MRTVSNGSTLIASNPLNAITSASIRPISARKRSSDRKYQGSTPNTIVNATKKVASPVVKTARVTAACTSPSAAPWNSSQMRLSR